jgi:hypothetical protein
MSLQVAGSYRDLDPGPLHSLLVLAGSSLPHLSCPNQSDMLSTPQYSYLTNPHDVHDSRVE